MRFDRFEITFPSDKLQKSKAFYQTHFGFQVLRENGWHLDMCSPERNIVISFLCAGREDGGFYTADEFFAEGSFTLSFEVDDVRAEYEHFVREGACIVAALGDTPGSEKCFVVSDPNGVHVYIYQAV